VFLRRKMPQKHSKTDLLYHRKIGVQAAIEGDILGHQHIDNHADHHDHLNCFAKEEILE